MELYPEELNFINFTKNIADLFQMRATQKGISFNYEQVSPLPYLGPCQSKKIAPNSHEFTQQCS